MRRPNPYLRKMLTWPLVLRVIVGLALVVGGILSLLPVLGIWMMPLGSMVMFSGSRQIRMAWLVWCRRLGTGLGGLWRRTAGG